MKQMIKNTLVIVALLLVSLESVAGGKYTVTYKLNGTDVTQGASLPGSVTYSNGEITVIPASGNYFSIDDKNDLIVIKTVDGSNAQTRNLNFNAPLDITAKDATADPSKETKYTFTFPGDEYDYEITANFHERTSISSNYGINIKAGPGTNGNYIYTGSAIKPEVTLTVGGKTLKLDEDFNAYYGSNNPAVADSIDAGPGVITLVGIRKYKDMLSGAGTNSVSTLQYTIEKADPTLTFDKAAATISFGKESEFAKPKLTTTPSNVTVKYTSADPTKATVGELTGDITPLAVGENIEIKATYDGDKNWNSGTGSYMLTVAKGTAEVSNAPTANTPTYTGKPQALISAGKAVNGEMQYKVEGGSYSTAIPTGTDAKDYTVYYKAVSTNVDKFNDSAEASITVTIKPKSIANATMTLDHESFVYNGQNQKPSVTLVKDGETELVLDTDYTVTNEGGTNAGEYTVTVAGKGNYDAQTTVTKKFTITKGTITLTYSSDKAEGKIGVAFTAPTLNNPSSVAVTYSSSNTDVATINDEGAVTLVGPGEATITASYAGDENHEAASASYKLSVVKLEAGLSWTDEGMKYYLGDWWYGPRLNNPNNLKVKYKSSDEEVATIDEKGVVTALAVGDTWIMAIFEGNEMYDPQTVRYGLFVRERYDLLVNDTRVTSDNNRNVLGDGHFFYDENTKQLVITSNENPVTIESRMKNLTIFLNGSSKLERVFFNNEGNEQNTGSLTFTTYENIPGSVVLETSHADGVISGFSSLTIDDKSYTYLLDPAEGKYKGGKLVTSLGAVATTATIGQYLKPLVDGHTVTFPPGKFAIDDFTNMVIDDILFTMVLRADGSDEDDDYYDPVESAIVLNNLNSTSGVTTLIDNVEKSILIPGSNEYALQFKGGITFMIPSGEGTITLNVKTEPGYKLMLMIGKSDPKEISQNEGGDVQFTYNVDKATYCCVYLVQAAGTRGTRIGKRDKVHGKVFSLKVTPSKSAYNPLGNIPGFPDSQTPEVVTGSVDPTGIINIPIKQETEAGEDNRWFTLSGQQIEQPTKAGLYIRNKKVIVIK